jgi:hypothetical protein
LNLFSREKNSNEEHWVILYAKLKGGSGGSGGGDF